MYEFKHEQGMFVKAEQTKALIRACFGEHLTNNDVQRCLARMWHNRYHNTAITEFDNQVNELLAKHNIDPKTAYNWIRATQLPEDVKSLIQNKTNFERLIRRQIDIPEAKRQEINQNYELVLLREQNKAAELKLKHLQLLKDMGITKEIN